MMDHHVKIISANASPDMATVKVPRLVARHIGGRTYHTWQPSKVVRALGFKQESFGTDEDRAIIRSLELNDQVEAARERLSSGALVPRFIEGSFRHAITLYRGEPGFKIEPSEEWEDLASRTRHDYGKYLDIIDAKWPDGLVRELTPGNVRNLKKLYRDHPYAGNYLLRVLSVVINFAAALPETFGEIHNPAAKVRKFGRKHGVTARRHYWSFDDEAAFLEAAEAADPEMVIYYYLLAYTGQRPGDVRGMDEADYDGEKIQVVQDKTGVEVWIPVHEDLKTALDAHLRRRRTAGRVGGPLIAGKKGGLLGERWAGRRWDKVAKQAGIDPELQRRDLRRTAVVRLAEAGCEVPRIGAITGHSIANVHQILETYLVRTYSMAKAAIIKLEDWTREQKATRRERTEDNWTPPFA